MTMLVRSIVIAGTLVAPSFALAQSPPAPKEPVAPKTEQLDPQACAQSDTRATVGQGGGDLQVPSRGDNLSQKLAKSDGVICPPQRVDPEIHAPAPQGGAMQVIPPPGSPGGDQNVKPK